ncbi:MAG TPA: hypothetical protein PK325_16745 [Cyclobacteriaceae bacterium]|nr:hypothetical protein [Cyclobacteriaceae bacterium]HMV09329.1 hypothetical protein [Cyclobacteriaceae bacterium]HMX01870.1 hypothetical protein [Cyclobacteriaceae bacterium]HMX50794.1 hypothetical protein [Cyclobacteriaceae bacterium]HMY94694.1 hypothetical protein [Cyclobacteriaceae bacterium]
MKKSFVIFVPSILLVIIIGMFWYQWCGLNNNLKQIRKDLRASQDSLKREKNPGPLNIELKPAGKTFTIDPKEIQRINNHIDALTSEVRSEAHRAESIIEKDLDRLNLLITVGIGFLAMVGVFVPLFFNLVSSQDMKEQQRELRSEVSTAMETMKTLDENVTNLGTSIKDVYGNVKKVGKKTDVAHLHVCNLMLQHAVTRFYNVASIIMAKSASGDEANYMRELFKNLKRALKACDDDEGHKICENPHFTQSIYDLHRMFSGNIVQHSIFTTRIQTAEVEAFTKCLDALQNSTKENEKANYEKMYERIDLIMGAWPDSKGNKAA